MISHFGNIPELVKKEKYLQDTPVYIDHTDFNTMYSDSLSIGALHQHSFVEIIRNKDPLDQIIIELNRRITDRINNCMNIFPSWIRLDYIKNLFIIPDGLKPDGILKAAKEYYSNINRYPYQVFLNWTYPTEGNLYYNDEKFATLLYEASFLSVFYDVSIAYSCIRPGKRILMLLYCVTTHPADMKLSGK